MTATTATAPALPIVLIGCGAVSQLFYVPSLKELERLGIAKVAGLVDRSSSALQTLHAHFPQATATDDLAKVPMDKGGLAIIATPPGLHLQHTQACAARGWHVLCEKPMAAKSGECPAMIEACQKAAVNLSIGHYKRYFPASLQLKELCRGQSPLGALLSYEIQEGGPFNWPAASPSFFQKAITPGGVLLDIGIHVFDLLIWWLDYPELILHEDDAMGGLEINTLTRLRHGKVEGCVRLSRDWNTRQQYRFVFERGQVCWTVNDANGLSIDIQGLPHGLKSTLTSEGQPAATNAQSFIGQLKATIAAARGEGSILVDGPQGMAALRLVEDCYAAKQFLSQPWLSPEEAAKARQLSTCTP